MLLGAKPPGGEVHSSPVGIRVSIGSKLADDEFIAVFVLAVPVTESVVLPPVWSRLMEISNKYRIKALACEKLAREARDLDIQSAWTEIAIEWHALANRVAADDEKATIDPAIEA
jgi:hypothetical protein